jgi:predicted RNA binding protein YcfA (HicA-like mRNA interferase family)
MMNEEKTRIVIPVHPGRKVKPGLVRAIMRGAGISRERSFKLLKGK